LLQEGEENMKKAISIVALSVLAVFVQSATGQKAEKFMNPILGGDVKEVKKLIDAGADVNGKFSLGATGAVPPLFLATMLGQTEICKVLIDAGADVHFTADGGLTLLHNVCLSNGDYREVADLLIAKGLDVNAKMAYGEARDATPLTTAAAKGNVTIAELLIQKGAEVNARIFYHSLTALHLAAREGKEKMIELLIANGAEINAKSKYGETPLDLAVSKDHKEVAELLRQHGGISGKQ
jgi:ankyrin repeat protein